MKKSSTPCGYEKSCCEESGMIHGCDQGRLCPRSRMMTDKELVDMGVWLVSSQVILAITSTIMVIVGIGLTAYCIWRL